MYIYTVHSIHHIYVYIYVYIIYIYILSMFQPATAQHIQKAQLKPSGVGVPGTLSPGTPLYVLRCHPSDPGYEKKGPLVMKLLCWFISIGLLWFIKVMYIHIIYMVIYGYDTYILIAIPNKIQG